MSMDNRQDTDGDSGDLTDFDESEQAESAWLIARETDATAQAPSFETEREYTELEDMLATLPSGAPDQSWHDDVLRVAAARSSQQLPWWRRRAVKWPTAGVLAAVAAAAAFLVLRPRTPPELQVAIHRNSSSEPGVEPMRAGLSEVVRGDHVYVTAIPRGSGDLRVYRADGMLVARCPRGPRCRTTGDRELIIDAELESPVQYFVVLVIGMRDAPLTWTMDKYLEAARATNARITIFQPIDVH